MIAINTKHIRIVLTIIGVVIALVGLQALLTAGNVTSDEGSNPEVSLEKIDKLQSVHFHAKQQC
jgi:hypothetical protein